MSSEVGSVITEKTTSAEANNALTKKLKWLWLALLVLGAIGVAAYIFISVSWEEIYGYEPEWSEIILILSAVPFSVGLIFTLATRSQRKADLKNANIQSSSQFFSDCIIYREFSGGEQIGVIRIDYNNILRTKQREGFIYLTVAQGVLYPVSVKCLTDEELNTVKKQLKMPVDENARTLELKVCDLVN